MDHAARRQEDQAKPERRVSKGRLRLTSLCAVVFFGLAACDGGSVAKTKPTGSPTDPVEVCEKPAQVCKFQGSQLGVCVNKPKEDSDCVGKSPCFVCVPQH